MVQQSSQFLGIFERPSALLAVRASRTAGWDRALLAFWNRKLQGGIERGEVRVRLPHASICDEASSNAFDTEITEITEFAENTEHTDTPNRAVATIREARNTADDL
jgi:hypothetical protein